MQKGSIEWFKRIGEILGKHLKGIEVSHFPETVDVTPRCKVVFVLDRFYHEAMPTEFEQLGRLQGYYQIGYISRGNISIRGTGQDLRHTIDYEFSDYEVCPKDIALQASEEFGFEVALDFLNNDRHTSRLSQDLFG